MELRAAPLTTSVGTSELGLAHDHSILDMSEPIAASNSPTTALEQESEYAEYQGIIPTVIIEHRDGEWLFFLGGARVRPRNIPSWLGHDILDRVESKPVTRRRSVPTATYSELLFEEEECGQTVSMEVPLGTTRCSPCSEAFVTHGDLVKHPSALDSTNVESVRERTQDIIQPRSTMRIAGRNAITPL